MISVAICDDESAEITYLSSLVRKWAQARDACLQLSDYASAESFLFAYEDNKAVDILLLDIQMKNMDGVTLAKQIRADNKAIQIIFITGYMDYISDGYDVEALHYLLKPVTQPSTFGWNARTKKALVQHAKACCRALFRRNPRSPYPA